jgi:hypothetical protein
MNNAAAVRLELVIPAAAGIPRVLEAARERLQALIRSPLRFAELHGSSVLRPSERRRIEPRRLERREAINLVGAAFLKHTDLCSLRVGSPRRDGHVTPPGHVRMQEETGLSLSRMRRAIRDGVRAGYWTSTQPRVAYKNSAGETRYAAFRVIYRLTDRFFGRLGLGRRIERERDRASARRSERRRIYAASLVEARDALGRMQRAKASRYEGRAASDDAAHNRARLGLELRIRLRAQHPEWPPERVSAEADRLIRG